MPLDDDAPPPAAPDSVDELVEKHLDYARALTHKIARRLPPSVDFEELCGFAYVGLTEAANKFQADLGVAFTTFSYYRIRGAVFDGLRKMTWLPPESRRRSNQESHEDDLLRSSNVGGDPAAGPEDLAAEFQDVVRSLGAVFLLSEASDDGTELDPEDPTSAADAAERVDLAQRVREALARLDEREQRVLTELYFEHRSMTDVAAEMGVNKATISRVHRRAVETLREQFCPD